MIYACKTNQFDHTNNIDSHSTYKFELSFFQVFPYGSVPLKTYLQDGDIDLTTVSIPPVVDTLVSDVYAILRGEENNQKAPYQVKDVHLIDAEVYTFLYP